MHPNNPFQKAYDFDELLKTNQDLEKYVIVKHGKRTIDFTNNKALVQLNKALLLSEFNLSHWEINATNLCPAIPGRTDYLLHLKDFLTEKGQIASHLRAFDVGTGANAVYSLIGTQLLGWEMTGSELNEEAYQQALKNVSGHQNLKHPILIRRQNDAASIFKNVIGEEECFDVTVCNPPFFISEEHARKEHLKKQKKIWGESTANLNFGGASHELWCNGGEYLFVKRMIKESLHFKAQVGWFSTLISKNENLLRLEKLLKKKGLEYHVIDMSQGHKRSRILIWKGT